MMMALLHGEREQLGALAGCGCPSVLVFGPTHRKPKQTALILPIFPICDMEGGTTQLEIWDSPETVEHRSAPLRYCGTSSFAGGPVLVSDQKW